MVYAEGLGHREADRVKTEQSKRTLDLLEAAGFILSTQALAELHYVLVRKAGLNAAAAASIVNKWREAARVVGVAEETVAEALALVAEHRLQILDAVILASIAGEADVLLSDDMQHGFAWRGVEIVNPFAPGARLPG